MAYSDIGIVNLGLIDLGVSPIAALSEDSGAAIAANAVYDYLRDEVLQARNWRFAKTRVALAQNTTSPVAVYDYAYTLPADFLRICLDKRDDPAVYPTGAYAQSYQFGELVVQGMKYGYIVETLEDGTLCLFTDYDNSSDDLFLTYIRKVTDPAKFSPTFIKVLAARIAWKLAYRLTESTTKRDEMKEAYKDALIEADAVDASSDWVEDESGSDAWEAAGR